MSLLPYKHYHLNVRHVKWRVRLGPYCVELRHGTLMWTLSLRSLATVRLHGRLGQNSFPQPVPEYNSTQYSSSLKSTRLYRKSLHNND